MQNTTMTSNTPTATEFLKTAINTAEHYGFSTLDSLRTHPEVRSAKRIAHAATAAARKNDGVHGLLSGGLKHYLDHKLHATESPTFFYTVEQVPRTGEVAVSFQVFGVPKSIAEAVLIQTIRSVLCDLGFDQHCVRINSVGDSDSHMRYTRELTNYLRKRLMDLPSSTREHMKDHAISALLDLIEQDHDLAHKSPNPLEYLTDQSRRHFREVIEYLDMSAVPYEIDASLIGHHACYSDTLFAVDVHDDAAPFSIQGGRYNNFRTETSALEDAAIGAVMILKDQKMPARTPKTKTEKPAIYVAHLGTGPKIQTLLLLDTLRQEGITTHQHFAANTIRDQLQAAEEMGLQHVVIMGQKEYVEGTVILRDTFAQNQEYIPIANLPQKLKRLTVA